MLFKWHDQNSGSLMPTRVLRLVVDHALVEKEQLTIKHIIPLIGDRRLRTQRYGGRRGSQAASLPGHLIREKTSHLTKSKTPQMTGAFGEFLLYSADLGQSRRV